LKSRKGDIVKIENITYKILDTGAMKIFRVSYIYLDGSQLSLESIDSIRKEIISKYKKGVSFEALAEQYTMDGNTAGDTGYFGENMMVAEFEDAIRQHKRGDVFTVDIPSHNWYHVVKKTYADQVYKGIKVLVIPDL
jgi:parvulin-like peptidyl-prolyl isomerase